ncbi:MAG: glycoside hydrolase family 2 TIM barrel-domain containing protein [Desulfovibrionaceae bacterium]|nr:glycoside hydrolase family 2 TIM barrel-domain containing protein [Desulfovibrionaceae bacterium]
MRKISAINQDWVFIHRAGCTPDTIPDGGEIIHLPHTWNAVDGHDGHAIHIKAGDWSKGDLTHAPASQYDRGSYWYYRRFSSPVQPLPGGRIYVEIPAAGLQATVYVNGRKAAYHEGGFSAFRADITDLCTAEGDNLLAVNVSNEYRSNVYPQHADFTFYGGLYRGISLISVPKAHFDLDFFGGPGIKVIPCPAEGDSAIWDITAYVKNADENFTIQYSIRDASGREAACAVRPATDSHIALPLPHAQLWSPEHPYLYTVTASLLRRNEVVDEISVRSGIRSFSCSPQDGFFLNGKPMPLRGVSRHQDWLYKGNALTREDHFEDARIIKELGANSIRLAHYQHAQDFYDACDELGFVVWAEIPFITIMNDDPAAHENCISQMQELIIQNAHHPCICFWGLSNEVLLAGKLSDKLVENHRELNALVKSLDPTRLTTLAHVSHTPEDCGLHDITDVEAYNHYFGWYVGKTEDNAPWLDRYHARYPRRCIGVSEYGCEGIITYHGAHPACKDYSEEYQALYHEEMARIFSLRPWVWGSYVWNMFDFGAAARNEGGVAGRNNKGLVTMDRKIKKDSYYIYRAYWNPEPMVHICGKRYAQRSGDTTQIRVYSNQTTVALYVNGTLTGTQSADKVFVFDVTLRPGMNTVTACAGELSDTAVLERVEREPDIYTAPRADDDKESRD